MKQYIMASSLKQQTISGMIWSSLQRFGTMGISFISNIVLARLLTPDDYGCIGMLMIFIALSSTFIDGGFGSALIQKKRPTTEDYSTIFYWNIFLSLVLYVVLYLCAPLVADFYNIELLSKVLQVQGVVLIINALGIIQANQLRKQLKFKALAKVNLAAAIASVVVAIAMAYMGCGIWSLVAQQIVQSLASTLLYWVYSSWRPIMSFSTKSFKELFGFGSFILLSNLINTFCNNLNGLLIGKFFNASSMGYFTQAKKLENIFSLSIEAVVLQVPYPVLVEVKDNFEKLRNVLKQFNSLLLYVVAP
ncbi:MAG: lipopolysaccharide biosynthesis protein [Bacteroidaceae bacterium]|nr:lipopolysaccharide biosynthesis protein [Bacteroidaceae bacterium]